MLYDRAAIIQFDDGSRSLDALLEIPPIKDYIEIRVKEDQHLQQIANERYRDTELWYIIAEFNPEIVDIFDIPYGTLLKIPILS